MDNLPRIELIQELRLIYFICANKSVYEKPDVTNHVSNGDGINLKTNFLIFECWPAGEIDSEWKTTKKKNLRTQFSYPHPSSTFTLLIQNLFNSICTSMYNKFKKYSKNREINRQFIKRRTDDIFCKKKIIFLLN